MHRLTGRIAVLSAAMALAAGCAQQLKPPTAQIKVVGSSTPAIGSIVQLDGSGSSDPNSLPLAFHWQMLNLPAGSHAAFNDPGILNPSFLADVGGEYDVQLVVNDGKWSSEPATVAVKAGPCGNQPLAVVIQGAPTSAIGGADGGGGSPDGGFPTGSLVQLQATVTDPNSPCLPGADAGTVEAFGYAWSFTSVPSGSQAKLNGSSLSDPSFVADIPGDYAVAVTATSPTGIQGTGTKTITVGSCGSNPPQIQEIAAQPAAPQIGQLVQLSSTVLQPDNAAPCSAGETLVYAWSFVALPSGSRAQLNAATIAQPSFLPDVPGAYTVRLEVTDSVGHLATPQTLTVTVSGCGGAIPKVTGITSAPALPDTGQTIQLQAAIGDADATACGLKPAYTYAWQIVGQPAGSRAALNNAAASDPSFTADLPGNYDVALVVTKVEFGAAPLPSSLPDAGMGAVDAGAVDAGATDAGASADAGAADSGTGVDAGASNDAGTSKDAGTSADAGMSSDGGASVAPWALATPIASARFVQRIVVSACGSAAPSVVANADPKPDVGQVVQLGVTVTDSNAEAACQLPEAFSYRWSVSALPQGSDAALNSTAVSAPSFTPDVPGEYDFSVVVTDSSGQSSAPAIEVVTASICGSAVPAVSATVSNSTPSVGETVQFAATATDSDSQPPCSLPVKIAYAWQLVQVPVGSNVQLNVPGASNPSFTPDVPGPYVAVVTVTDQHGRSSFSTPVTVTAGTCGSLVPVVTIAGPSGSVNTGAPVQLAAQVVDGNAAASCGLTENESYRWWFTAVPAGSRAALNGASLSDPSFTPDVAGEYGLTVAVTDSSGLTGQQNVAVTAVACGSNPPVIDPGSFQANPASPVLGEPTQISASFSDADNDPGCALGRTFSYAWTLIGLPQGSQASLNDPRSLEPSFTPDVVGDYTFSLTVTDNLGRSSTAPTGTWTVTATNCGMARPAITLPDVSVDTFQAAQLGVGGTGALTDANTACASAFPNATVTDFSYAWKLVGLPLGSQARIDTPWASNASFVPDVTGTYTAEVVVTDGLGNQSLPTDQKITVSACGGAAPVPNVGIAVEYCCGTTNTNVCTEGCQGGNGTQGSPCIVPAQTAFACALNGQPMLALTAAGTSDADTVSPCNLSETLSYLWELFALPVGSGAKLNPSSGNGEFSDSLTPWMRIDSAGTYILRLSATDGTPARANPPELFYIQAQ